MEDSTQPASLPGRAQAVERIAALRSAGPLSEAIAACASAIRDWPTDAFFIRIYSDLLFQAGRHQDAFVALADFLSIDKPSISLVSAFGKRYSRFRKVLPKDEMARYAKFLSNALARARLHPKLQESVQRIILPDLELHAVALGGAQVARLKDSLQDDTSFDEFVRAARKAEEASPDNLIAILDAVVLSRPRALNTFQIDLHCVSIFEKLGRLDSALRVAAELLEIKLDTTAARSLLRICRFKKDYAQADKLLEKHPALLRWREFNLLYELVYYFEAKDDFHEVRGTLNTIEKVYSASFPAMRTLRNFYIRFGLINEARSLEEKIATLTRPGHGGGKFTAQVAESEIELASKVQDLYSQLEHQKQLAAISDLTTGISHELGQPITNIRYTLQFYRRKFQTGVSTEDVNIVFDSILEETERMGGLIRRLSPLTSSRSVVTQFDVLERIRLRIDGERPRLTEGGIEVQLVPHSPIYFDGDTVKFDQLISNLLLNAMDAVDERHPNGGGRIEINVDDLDDGLQIAFADNGPGVPFGIRNQIFDPFYSTKAPGKGEGLGLFIIWNLLKMVGGRIWVEPAYKRGAKFVLHMPRIAVADKEKLS